MNSAKAKQAKSKATKAKAARNSERNGAQQQQAAADQIAAMQGRLPGTGINPEIQAQQIAMQNQTQTFNPYHAMGMMAPNTYNPGNMIDGERWSHGTD